MRPIVLGLVPWLLLTAACGAVAPESMVSIGPPKAWEAGIDAYRAAKDELFRKGPDSPLLAEDVESFTGLRYWRPDAGLYFAGPINVYDRKEQFQIITTAGKARDCERFGWIEFPVEDLPRRLQVYRLLDMGGGLTTDSLLLPFTDATTGKETYPAGRYVDLEGPPGPIPIVRRPDGSLMAVGPYVLDFNRAYNPSCAYGAPERFACPVTPRENRLGVRIEAGERGYSSGPAAPSG